MWRHLRAWRVMFSLSAAASRRRARKRVKKIRRPCQSEVKCHAQESRVTAQPSVDAGMCCCWSGSGVGCDGGARLGLEAKVSERRRWYVLLLEWERGRV